MKALASLILGCSILFGMGADTIESLTLCKNTKTGDTYLVTVSNNETEGRAIWIDNYDQLIGEDTNSILLPIQDKKSFKSTKQIQVFMSLHFGKVTCIKTTEESVQIELDKQTEEYTGKKVFR